MAVNSRKVLLPLVQEGRQHASIGVSKAGEFARHLLAPDGHSAISEMPHRDLRACLEGPGLLPALCGPDSLPQPQKACLEENLTALFLEDKFVLALSESLSEPQKGRELRILASELMLSKAGKRLRQSFGLSFLFRNFLPSYGKVPPSVREAEFSLLSHPEGPLRAFTFSGIERELHDDLISYVQTGAVFKKDKLLSIMAQHPREGSLIFRSGDVRSILSRSLSNDLWGRRAGGLFLEPPLLSSLSIALDSPEGLNLASYLWHFNAPSPFMQGMADAMERMEPPQLIAAVDMVLEKQAAFMESGRPTYRENAEWLSMAVPDEPSAAESKSL